MPENIYTNIDRRAVLSSSPLLKFNTLPGLPCSRRPDTSFLHTLFIHYTFFRKLRNYSFGRRLPFYVIFILCSLLSTFIIPVECHIDSPLRISTTASSQLFTGSDTSQLSSLIFLYIVLQHFMRQNLK